MEGVPEVFTCQQVVQPDGQWVGTLVHLFIIQLSSPLWVIRVWVEGKMRLCERALIKRGGRMNIVLLREGGFVGTYTYTQVYVQHYFEVSYSRI